MSLRSNALALAAVAGVLLTACERPPVKSTQYGYRGVAIEQNVNPRTDAALRAQNVLPPAIPAAPTDSASVKPMVGQNIQVLNGLSTGEFTRTMTAITAWVAPKQGCLYCHLVKDGQINYASDDLYTKVVARRMLQMTQKVNSEYTGHVAQTGVTCYTCHRGNNVPANIWFYTDQTQPLRHYLDRQDFRVQGHEALPVDSKNRSSIRQTEYSYALMINMSTSLGVNCTYCHNSRQWSDWNQSSPKRIVALRGIRMARDLNTNYLVPLQSAWPANRLGPHGDGPKLQCSTCHNGVYKPLYGQAMAKDYPALYPIATPAPAATDSAPAKK